MDTSIEDVFCAHTSKGVTRYGRTKDRMRAVNGHASNSVARIEWRPVFEKEGSNGKKICLTNLVAEKLSYLPALDHERVKAARKDSKALGTHAANDFKAVIRMNLMRDNQATTEDVTLTEKTFVPEVRDSKV